jgi:butyryl-CoA dehydrogenase
MDFRLTPEQQMVRDMARDFVDKEVMPHAREWEEKGEIPRSVTDEMADLGFMGAPTPVEYGGAGMDYVSFMLLIEEIARGSSSLRTTMSVHISLAQSHLLKWASEEQKQKWVVPLARGVKHGAWALTEPNAGSDAANQQTTARKEGDHYILNGAKRFISDGGVADYVIVFARLPGTQKYDGICSFLMEKGTPGFSVPKTETKTKLGLRASPTADLAFDDCKIPADHLIGKEGDGWNQAMYVLNQGRLGVAAGAVGLARAAFEAAVKYSKERKTFGRQIGAWQLIKEMIAESAVDIDAARFLVLRAAQQKDLGEDNTLAVSMAKLFGAQMAQRVTDRAIQIHGGYGFSGDFEVERYFRDARILGLYEGTNEIQKIIISDRILGPLEKK